MKVSKKWRIILLVAVLSGVLCSIGFALHLSARLLERAELPLSCIRHVYDLGVWTDPLGYKDSYEWVILRVSGDFLPPEGWVQKNATLLEINPPASNRSRHYFDASFTENQFLPKTFSTWFYIPHDDATPFEERDWFAAMYDTATNTLALYRGHTLCGF